MTATYGTRVSVGFGGARVEHMAPAFPRGLAGRAWNMWHLRFCWIPRARAEDMARACVHLFVDLSPNSSAASKNAKFELIVATIALKNIHK